MFRGCTLGVVMAWLCAACQPSEPAAAAPTSHTAANPAASALLPPQCDNIPLQMSAITANSDLQTLSVVNQALKRCTPLVDETTRFQWLDKSWEMYQRFLDLGLLNQKSSVWDEFSGTLEGYPEESSDERQARLQRQAELWPKLTPRMQQMSGWLGKEYIDNFYIGDGMMELRRHPNYLVDIFAPVLPEAERNFINELAKENIQLTTNDAALVIPWSELARRTLFWEHYSLQFPNSRYAKQAQYLFEWNEALLYRGLDNTPLISNQQGVVHFNQEALLVHQQLAQQTDSTLGKKSQALLQWYDAHAKQAVTKPAEHAQIERELASLRKKYQLNTPVAETHLDCYSDALCHQ